MNFCYDVLFTFELGLCDLFGILGGGDYTGIMCKWICTCVVLA